MADAASLPGKDRSPLGAGTVLLAILPGILAMTGLIGMDFNEWSFLGFLLLIVLAAASRVVNHRWASIWSLMALGMSLYFAWKILTGTLGAIWALILTVVSGTPAVGDTLIIALIVWIPVAILFWRNRRSFSAKTRLLLGLIILFAFIVRLKYCILEGVSWPTTQEVVTLALMSVGDLLLIVAAGSLLTPRHGLRTMLFVIGGMYLWFQTLMDPGQNLSAVFGGTPNWILYQALIPFVVVVIATLGYLLQQDPGKSLLCAMVSIGAAIGVTFILLGIVKPYPLWLYFVSIIPFVISALLAVPFAHIWFEEIGRQAAKG
jgi:hypothetical protein